MPEPGPRGASSEVPTLQTGKPSSLWPQRSIRVHPEGRRWQGCGPGASTPCSNLRGSPQDTHSVRADLTWPVGSFHTGSGLTDSTGIT